MKELIITDSNARKYFTNSNPALQQALIDQFGKEFFDCIPFEQITSFEIACEVTGDDPTHPKFNEGDIRDTGLERLKVIVKAINPEGYRPNYEDGNEKKWWPWMRYEKGGGFRFGVSLYGAVIRVSPAALSLL